ncbi:MAG: hypothetical protein AAF723_08050, partial [Pseudomonadota bacterium]
MSNTAPRQNEIAEEGEPAPKKVRFAYSFAKENGIVFLGLPEEGKALIGVRSDEAGKVTTDPWALAEAYRAAAMPVQIEPLP